MALTLKTAKPGAGMQLGAVAWDKLMNSGAGMVPMYLSRPQPRMSVTAKRFLQICSFIERELQEPHKSAQADHDLYVNCCRRRELAADLIGYGCEPSIVDDPLTPNFCQAGVVAPPDSLMDEKTRCELNAMGEAWEAGRAEREADELIAHEQRFFESQLMSGDR